MVTVGRVVINKLHQQVLYGLQEQDLPMKEQRGTLVGLVSLLLTLLVLHLFTVILKL